jgi:hypothetical protein
MFLAGLAVAHGDGLLYLVGGAYQTFNRWQADCVVEIIRTVII